MKSLTLIMLLISTAAYSQSKERLAEIAASNAAAMKKAYETPYIDQFKNTEGEAENEVVTDKEFKKVQKERREAEKKYLIYPAVPSANLISPEMKGKKFRMMVDADGAKKVYDLKMKLDIVYNISERDFKHSGNGTYLLKCEIKSCLQQARFDSEVGTKANGDFIEEEVVKMGSFNAVVEVTGERDESVTPSGKKIVMPVLKIVETY